MTDYLLLKEDGDKLLKEDGDGILLDGIALVVSYIAAIYNYFSRRRG